MKCSYDSGECWQIGKVAICDECPRKISNVTDTNTAASSPPPADDRNDPAMSCTFERSDGEIAEYPGFTRLERACLDLRLPESGTAWLDALIRKAQLRDVAARIAAPFIQRLSEIHPIEDEMPRVIAKYADMFAAALIERTGKGE